MRRVVIFLVVFLLPLPLWAIRPLSDADLSNLTMQNGELSIHPDQLKGISNKDNVLDDSDDISKFWKNSKEAAIAVDNSKDISNPPPPKMKHGISFPDGYSGSANEKAPMVVDIPIRTYYTGRADFSIAPNSFVDHENR